MKQKVFEPYVEKEYLCRNLEMFGNLHLKITVLYMEKQRMIKFTQVGCYSMHWERIKCSQKKQCLLLNSNMNNNEEA